MRPQVKSTILISVLALSLALNISLVIGLLSGAETDGREAVSADTAKAWCLLDDLRLDEGQRGQLREMRQEMQRKRGKFWQRSAEIKAQLSEAICARPSDRAQIDALLDHYLKIQAGMQRVVADHLLNVSAMLRPGQMEEFRTLLRTEMFRGIRAVPAGTVGEP